MKDFMLVFLGVNYAELNLSPEEMQGRIGKWMAWQQKMEQSNTVKSGNALQSVVKRVSGPDRTVTDMAATEIKELIGGYYIVSARDFDHAIEIAQDYPDYDVNGTVEVREVTVY